MAENRIDNPQVILFGNFSSEECQYFQAEQNSNTIHSPTLIPGIPNEDQIEKCEHAVSSLSFGESSFSTDGSPSGAHEKKPNHAFQLADGGDSEQETKQNTEGEYAATAEDAVQATDTRALNNDVGPEELVLCLFNDLNSGSFQGDDKLPICGFNNIGNGCFLNSSLQVLFACRPLQAFLEALRVSDVLTNKKNIPALEAFSFLSTEMYCDALRLLPAQITSINRGDYVKVLPKSVTPHEFEELLKKFRQNTAEESLYISTSSQAKESQEDAHELLMFLLDNLHEEALQLEADWKANRTGSAQDAFDDDGEWEEVGSHKQKAVIREVSLKDSVISSTFMGKCRTTVKVHGSKPSVTVEPFLHLPLGILPAEISTVTDAIRMISKEELVPGYKKSSEGNELVASKICTIEQLPNILVLQLMRFTFTENGSTKVRKPVKFEERLDIPREVLSPGQRSNNVSTQYRLLATINHHGQAAVRGHYTASVRRKDAWYSVDDDQVSSVDISQVTSANSQRQVYVLFYERT